MKCFRWVVNRKMQILGEWFSNKIRFANIQFSIGSQRYSTSIFFCWWQNVEHIGFDFQWKIKNCVQCCKTQIKISFLIITRRTWPFEIRISLLRNSQFSINLKYSCIRFICLHDINYIVSQYTQIHNDTNVQRLLISWKRIMQLIRICLIDLAQLNLLNA